MNNLPDDVIQQIYEYKHTMEYVNVMDQLLQAKINVYFNISLKQSKMMCYVKTNIKYLSLNVNELYVTLAQLLNTIKYYKKNDVNHMLLFILFF